MPEHQLGWAKLLLKLNDFCAAIHIMDSKKLDLNLLVAFETLIAERNVSKAALRLNLSQPALSAQLKRLRIMFGDQLLIPAQRGMIATARALELQKPLHDALETVRVVIAEKTTFDPKTIDTVVTVSASDYVQHSLLRPLTFALRTEAPRMRLSWRGIDALELVGQTETGEVDLGIMRLEAAPDQLLSRKLFDEKYVAVVSRNHSKVKNKLDLNTFCALDHVVVSPRGGGFLGPTDEALEALGRRRTVALSVSNFLMVPEIIESSDMIAVLPERLVRDRNRQLKIFEPPLKIRGFTIAMLWHDRTSTDPVRRWLRDKIAAL